MMEYVVLLQCVVSRQLNISSWTEYVAKTFQAKISFAGNKKADTYDFGNVHCACAGAINERAMHKSGFFVCNK